MSTMEVKTVCGNCGEVAVKTLPVDGKGMDSRPQGNGMAQDDLPDNAGFVEKRKKGKKRRIHRLTNDQGVVIREVALADTGKSLQDDDDAFLCAIDRKVLPGSASACSNCPGGCCNSKGLPTLIEVEGLAEEEHNAEVLDSGYGAKADLFVVQLKRADGKIIEAFYDGKTAECQGWSLLNSDLLDVKSLEGSKVIDADEAKEIALKSIEGEAVAVDPDNFDGADAWAVQVTGKDGRSYDVFVSLKGDVLGFDDYGPLAKTEDEPEVKEGGDAGEATPPAEPEGDKPAGDDEPVADDEPKKGDEPEEKAVPVEDPELLEALAELKSLSIG
jgi:uncharacterized membrane protein YkoI